MDKTQKKKKEIVEFRVCGYEFESISVVAWFTFPGLPFPFLLSLPLKDVKCIMNIGFDMEYARYKV